VGGVRLVHDSLRGGKYVVEHPTRRYRVPLLCPSCGKVHEHKAYHLELDGEGAVIVSEKVFQRLREAGLPGLSVANAVRRPPTIRLQIGDQLQAFEAVGYAKAPGRLPRLTVLRNKLKSPRRIDG
jgi:hypothetical protein